MLFCASICVYLWFNPSMDIFFADPSEIPLPPAEIRIRSLEAQPWPDGRRVKISLDLDPFQKPPSLELTLLDPGNVVAGSADIIETMSRRMELNLHLRSDPQPGDYTLEAVLFYLEHRPVEEGEANESFPYRRMVVDAAQVRCTLVT